MYSDSKLVERTQRDNGQPISDKLADDLYIIYQYREEANNVSELRQCISKNRANTVVSDENDTSLVDIFQKLSNNIENNRNTEITVVVADRTENHETIKPLSDQVEKFTKHFEKQISELNKRLKEKDMTIDNLREQISESQLNRK